MATSPKPDGQDEPNRPREFLRQSFVTGTAVTLPLIVTLIVLGVVVNFVSRQLDPLVGVITSMTGIGAASELAIKLTALGVLLVAVFLIGAVTEYRPGRSEVGSLVEALIARIPGVGSLYRSLDEMSGLLLDTDTESFREVKLVEFPVDGSFAIAFLTAETPSVVEAGADHEGMCTVFLPLAPNPVMGGFVLHVAPDRVHDIDLTVEEGIQSIVTSGVATGRHTESALSEDMLARIERRLRTTIADLEEVAGLEAHGPVTDSRESGRNDPVDER